MRRLNLPPRTCACGALMIRCRYKNGRLEPPKRFSRRRFCSHACKSIGYLKPAKNKQRTCLQCGERLVRKQFRGGRWEERKTFARRRFCDNACKRRYIDDPLTGAEYGRYWAERLAEARAKKAAAAKAVARTEARRSPAETHKGVPHLCFHGEPRLCDICAEIARITGGRGWELMRPRAAWEPLWNAA